MVVGRPCALGGETTKAVVACRHNTLATKIVRIIQHRFLPQLVSSRFMACISESLLHVIGWTFACNAPPANASMKIHSSRRADNDVSTFVFARARRSQKETPSETRACVRCHHARFVAFDDDQSCCSLLIHYNLSYIHYCHHHAQHSATYRTRLGLGQCRKIRRKDQGAKDGTRDYCRQSQWNTRD